MYKFFCSFTPSWRTFWESLLFGNICVERYTHYTLSPLSDLNFRITGHNVIFSS